MTIQTWILVAVFISVASLTMGVGLWVTRTGSIGLRMGQLKDITDKPLANDSMARLWRLKVTKLTAPLAKLSAPKEGWEDSNLRVHFMQAGLRGNVWPLFFFSSKTLLAIGLPGAYMLLGNLGAEAVNQQVVVLTLLLLAACGYYLPNMLLSQAIRSRQQELQDALPDAIDLMTVCVEAGLGLDAALQRAGAEMDFRSKALSDELNLMNLELRIGSARATALENLALRTGLDDIATFVSTLIQAEHFGTNVADSLRILAETMRDHRRLRAEETAAKIPLKLLFPLIFFIFPSLFLVLMGPAMINISRTLLPTLGGGR